jgi:hypothetical protein
MRLRFKIWGLCPTINGSIRRLRTATEAAEHTHRPGSPYWTSTGFSDTGEGAFFGWVDWCGDGDLGTDE